VGLSRLGSVPGAPAGLTVGLTPSLAAPAGIRRRP
jgi:hypothetical protein